MTSKINANSPKTIPEHTGAKPKATIPLRVLDEEVWISGSELKTDNDSSDDDKGRLRKVAEAKVKKGARRKIKNITSSVTKPERPEQLPVLKTETDEVEDKLLSTSGNVENVPIPSVQWRPKREISIEQFFDSKEFRDCDDFLKKLEDTDTEEYHNQADDEKSQLQKINLLEKRIRNAEKEYMDARLNTDRLVRKMLDILHSANDCKEPEWRYFIEITKKWINCVTKSSSTLKFQAELSYTQDNSDSESNKKFKKRAARKLSSKHFVKNAKQISRNKSEKQTNCEHTLKNTLDVVLRSIEDRSEDDFFYEPYKFTSHEMDRISEIDQQLKSFNSCVSLDQVDDQMNIFKENEPLNELHNQPLSDYEKLQFCKNQFESNNAEEEFDSCEEYSSSRRC